MTRLENSMTNVIGRLQTDTKPELLSFSLLQELVYHINQSFIIVETGKGPGLAKGPGVISLQSPHDASKNSYPIIGFVTATPLDALGDPSFRHDWSVRYPVIGGSMANGISSVDLISTLAHSGMIGFYGSAGQDIHSVEKIIHDLNERCTGLPWGVNLIHSPQEPMLEDQLVDLLIDNDIRRIEASAYMAMTRALVRYRLHGIHQDPAGEIITPNQILAKASRVEIARKFFSPAPDNIVRELLADGLITTAEAQLADKIPIARDITAEADSGGHTDNRPLVTLLPSFQAVARDCMATFRYSHGLRVGAAGGIGTPGSAAAAFAMGAAWILLGSVAQAAVESGTSAAVRRMLAEVEQAEIAMAPAADMFELGVNLQVLKRGTLFPMRAKKLYDIYRQYDSIDTIPAAERLNLEKTIFRAPLEQVWDDTQTFWNARDPGQVERATHDPKHKLALVFRWYLGLSSRWANAGDPARKLDYQVWCGPSMGAFNQWVRGSFLENPDERKIRVIMMNILWGSAVLNRLVDLQPGLPDMIDRLRDIRPQPLQSLQAFIETNEVYL